jgi:MFS family permease
MASVPSPERTDARAPLMTTRQAFLRVFPGVMVAMFLAAADQTILASALPTIASSLHGFADISWVVVSYLLAATIAAPLYGHLGDRFGRRRMLLGALAIFTAASMACAFAPTLLLLIAARAVQGLGGGGLMTLAQALIGEPTQGPGDSRQCTGEYRLIGRSEKHRDHYAGKNLKKCLA